MSSSIEVISQKLIGRGQTAVAEQQSALKTATGLWAEATTAATTGVRAENHAQARQAQPKNL